MCCNFEELKDPFLTAFLSAVCAADDTLPCYIVTSNSGIDVSEDEMGRLSLLDILEMRKSRFS